MIVQKNYAYTCQEFPCLQHGTKLSLWAAGTWTAQLQKWTWHPTQATPWSVTKYLKEHSVIPCVELLFLKCSWREFTWNVTYFPPRISVKESPGQKRKEPAKPMIFIHENAVKIPWKKNWKTFKISLFMSHEFFPPTQKIMKFPCFNEIWKHPQIQWQGFFHGASIHGFLMTCKIHGPSQDEMQSLMYLKGVLKIH